MREMFVTVMHGLLSPQNVGMIVRTHVALGGGPLIILGHERPWRFKKSTQAFSRKLETLCKINYLNTEEAFFEWCMAGSWQPVAVEIREDARPICDMEWPSRPAIVLGNERTGLSDEFLLRCNHVARIPQFGGVGSLNVAVSHAIAAHEFKRGSNGVVHFDGGKYAVEST